MPIFLSVLLADLASAVTVLDVNGRAGVPSLLISGPWMGKSRLVRELAAADGVLCKTVLGSLREPSDFAGLPVVRENGVTLKAPAWEKESVAGVESDRVRARTDEARRLLADGWTPSQEPELPPSALG